MKPITRETWIKELYYGLLTWDIHTRLPHSLLGAEQLLQLPPPYDCFLPESPTYSYFIRWDYRLGSEDGLEALDLFFAYVKDHNYGPGHFTDYCSDKMEAAMEADGDTDEDDLWDEDKMSEENKEEESEGSQGEEEDQNLIASEPEPSSCGEEESYDTDCDDDE